MYYSNDISNRLRCSRICEAMRSGNFGGLGILIGKNLWLRRDRVVHMSCEDKEEGTEFGEEIKVCYH